MPESAENPEGAPRPQQHPKVIRLPIQQEVQKPREHESFAQLLSRKLFGDTPPEGLGFRSGIRFITGERHYHYQRALTKFRRYLAEELGWTTEKINAWLAEPEGKQRWNRMQLATHRYAFAEWWTAAQQQTHLRLLRNLRRGSNPPEK